MEQQREYLRIAIEAARTAGRLQMEHVRHDHPVEYKGAFDPVTEVDRMCERAIFEIILGAFPDHDILSEESPFEEKGSPFRWIVDPIDGTTNYSRGFPFFCVSIGLEIEGELKLGVVFVPPLSELFHAEKGRGAYLNGNRIWVSKVQQLGKSLLCTGFPYDVQDRPDFYLRYFRQFISRSFALRRPGSAAIDLCYVAAGRFDGFWEWNLHAWDVAASSLLVTEAGGRMTDFQGGPYSIYSKQALASNGVIHQAMLQAMREVDEKQEKEAGGNTGSEV